MTKTLRTQDFGKNEDENHANEESWLLGSTTDTSITDDTDGKTTKAVSSSFEEGKDLHTQQRDLPNPH